MSKSKTPSGSGGLLPFFIVLHVITVLLTGGYTASTLAADGSLGAGDVALTAAVIAMLFCGLFSLSHFGVKRLPELRNQLFSVALAFWIVAATVVALISGTTSAAMIASTRGQVTHQEQFLANSARSFSERGNLIRQVEGLQHALANCKKTALDARKKELATGEISKTGGGDGQTARELKAIADSCESAGSIIINARSKTQPLFKQADRIADRMRRTIEDPAISIREKNKSLIDGSEALSIIEDSLVAELSLGSLDAVTDNLTRDFAYIGLTNSAVQYLETTYRPIARQILNVIDEAAITLDKPFPQFERRSSLELLTLYPGALIVAISLAGVLEIIPLIIVGFVILIALQQRRDDDDDGDNDGKTIVTLHTIQGGAQSGRNV